MQLDGVCQRQPCETDGVETGPSRQNLFLINLKLIRIEFDLGIENILTTLEAV